MLIYTKAIFMRGGGQAPPEKRTGPDLGGMDNLSERGESLIRVDDVRIVGMRRECGTDGLEQFRDRIRRVQVD